jgi:septal ring factor EnvC (AmiA/AmiB activator)
MRLFILLILFSFFFQIVSAQTREELEQQRIQTAHDIKFTNELIEQTKKNKNLSYNKVVLIESKIKSRESIINSIGKEINYLNDNILTHQELVYGLENDLESLKNEYAKIIYNSFKNKSHADKIMFVLASDNFNTAFKRLKYYQQYAKYRKLQADRILESKNNLANEIIQLEILKADKKD